MLRPRESIPCDQGLLTKARQSPGDGHRGQSLAQVAVGGEVFQVQFVRAEAESALGDQFEDVAGVHPAAQDGDPVADELLHEPVVEGALEAVLLEHSHQAPVGQPAVDARLLPAGLLGLAAVHGAQVLRGDGGAEQASGVRPAVFRL